MCGQLHALADLNPGKNPGTKCMCGWMDHRVGLDGLEKRETSWHSRNSNTRPFIP